MESGLLIHCAHSGPNKRNIYLKRRKRMQRNERYTELDALRGIAAMLVVLFHFSWGRPENHFEFSVGNTGVDLFFIISGFVIFMSLEKASSLREFAGNRFARLYPAYWACVILTYTLMQIYYQFNVIDYEKVHWRQLLANLTMFQHYIGMPDIDGPYWTLLVELNFYILMGLLYKLRLLRYIEILGTGASLVFVFLSYNIGYPSIKFLFSILPVMHYFPLFFMGMLCYKIYNGQGSKPVILTLILVCTLSQCLMFESTGRGIFLKQSTYFYAMLTYTLVFVILAFQKLKFLRIKPLLFVGKVSYPLYLTHQFVCLNLLFPCFADRLGINFYLSAFAIVLPILIALAALITFFIEIPAQRKLKLFFKRVLLHQH